MRPWLPLLAAFGVLAVQAGCRPAPQAASPATPSPTPELPYRPSAGPPSLAPQATPGSQAPGLGDQQRVERLLQEAN